MSNQLIVPANFKDNLKPLLSLIAHSSQLDEVALLTRLDDHQNTDIQGILNLIVSAACSSEYMDESTVLTFQVLTDQSGTVLGVQVSFLEMSDDQQSSTLFMNIICVGGAITLGGPCFAISEEPMQSTHKSPSSFVMLQEPLPTIKRKLARLNDASLTLLSLYLNNLENTDEEGDSIIIELIDSIETMLVGPHPIARKLTAHLPAFTKLVDEILGDDKAFAALKAISQQKNGIPLNNLDVVTVFGGYINPENPHMSALEMDFKYNNLRTSAQEINVYFNIPGLEEVILHLGIEEDILLVTNFGEFNLTGECNVYLDDLHNRLGQEEQLSVYCQQMLRLLRIIRLWVRRGADSQKLRTLNHAQRLLASSATVQTVKL